jgi:signal transduction histidine kinase
LQLRFSLDALSSRVHQAQRLVLVYVVLYGAILTLFGVYLLSRNVVKPIRSLNRATEDVAAGSLETISVPAGPSEITALAQSFNQMVAALRSSRAETETHIHSLERSNQALQQARQELVRSEKLATVGHLAAGMAHEIGNPLAAVIGYLNVLQMDLVDEQNSDLVKRSLAETQRIDLLVRELLDYATPAPSETEVFDPVAVLKEALEMMRHQGSFDGLTIDAERLVAGHSVRMNRSRLLQVFVNLLINARDAMADGGLLTLSSALDSQGVRLDIIDQGGGITPDCLAHIFEPFYTTKDPDKGRGLGLAVCQRITDEAGGRISVDSLDGEGSTFTVWLPKVLEGDGDG